ncbi:hypothetical protein [Blattabacterium cuenoti]|uniref:Lipoprotein n=1 Tax=Blattabacterium cuenoti STAT TaxID=1457030 RepID=A0A224AL41_9FLAO|nr:hypothetical protein [Blattabacterium cuenoti]BBA17350.1 hypothetical protein STAT_433 [Blattabacterium cuenoti STAT]
MAYKKIFFILTFISSYMMFSCYHSSFSDKKKTIEIGKITERVNIPRRSISFDFKRSIEDYIMEHNPSNLVIKNGDVVLEGTFLHYAVIPLEDSPLKKIKLTMKIYYKDKIEPEKNWEKCFNVSENFSRNEKDIFSKKIIDKIIENLTTEVYREIFHDFNETW